MAHEIVYIIGLIISIVNIFLGVWLIGITGKNLRKVSVFLTLISLFLVLDGISLTFQDITGDTISSNTPLLKTIADLRPLTFISQIQYTTLSLFLMLTLWN